MSEADYVNRGYNLHMAYTRELYESERSRADVRTLRFYYPFFTFKSKTDEEKINRGKRYELESRCQKLTWTKDFAKCK
mgnify:CR=1 FL=1